MKKMKIMMKIADKKFRRLGYECVYETERVVDYEKKTDSGYVHTIELIYKCRGQHICISYEKGCNSDGYNNAVGMTAQEMRWARRKMHELGR